jgi:signal peptidase I
MLRELIETVLVCVVFVLFLRAYVFQQSEIPSASMESTILIGDHVLVNRFLYAPTSFEWERRLLPIRDLRRGEVVVFKHPPEPEQDFIKRVIGLPGETIELRNGRLLIDGRPIHEPYLEEHATVGQSFGPELVQPGKYFLMGDNRNRSADSRVWGAADQHLIKGRAFMILFSTSARPTPGQPPGQVTATSLVRKLYNLVFHSRWERCLSLIR